jgi:ATP-dependent RNA helicase DDX5/DBP2
VHIDCYFNYFLKILIFTDTKRECDNLTMSLKQSGYQVAALHGDKDQREREYVLKAFRSGKIMTVVATDVAARGLGMCFVLMVENNKL